MTRIVAIRPEPGLTATLARARTMGLAITGEPLFEIRPLDWDAPPLASFDTLLVGSANALRHGGPALDGYRHLPVHAVGTATARIARSKGFEVTLVGEGGLQALLDEVGLDKAGVDRRYLRLAGREHVALHPPDGTTIIRRVIYESAALPMPEPLAAMLGEGAVVLLHSGIAAHHLAGECDWLGLDRKRIAIAALAPRVAEAAGERWADLRVAERPADAALLALAQEMCQ